MKKSLVGAAAALLAAGMLAGCGVQSDTPLDGMEVDQEESLGGSDNPEVPEEPATAQPDIPLNEMEVDQYVTLGDYNNLEVSVEPVTVDEAELEEWLINIYFGNMTAEDGITDRAVEMGDTVSIDYEGKKDGVAFQGGTAQGASLTIGSGRFIDGFEDGLVGVMPGETVDLDLTFPEEYRNAELAGQAVVFTVTVNYIVPRVEEMKDSVAASLGLEGVTGIETLRQYLYDYLYYNAESSYRESLESQILDQLMAQCTFGELPETLLESYKGVFANNLEQQAASMGITAEDLAGYYFAMTAEEFAYTYAEQSVRESLALQAIANRENLTVSDEELQAQLEIYAANAGYGSVEEFVGGTSLEDYRNYFMTEKVLEFLINNLKEN